MSNIRKIAVLLLAGALLAGSGLFSIASAQVDPGKLVEFKNRREAQIDEILAQLDLSSDQKKEIADLRTSREDVKEARKKRRELRAALREARQSKDEAAIAKAKEDLANFKVEPPKTIRSVLTEEQRAKFDELNKAKIAELRAENEKLRKERAAKMEAAKAAEKKE